MSNLTLKQKIMVLIGALGLILILIFQRGIYNPPSQNTAQQTSVKSEEPQMVSSNPVDQSIVMPTQSIIITFNYPIENVGEFKHQIEPKLEYKVELSDDRKTAKIIPLKTYSVGTVYTVFIRPETKFDGKGTLGKDIILHFRTIDYRGI